MCVFVSQEIINSSFVFARELLQGLKSKGFRLNFGEDNSGFFPQFWKRGGGYYLGKDSRLSCEYCLEHFHPDVGASQLIIDGKIKLKSGSQISHFTKEGIVFEDGSSLPADVVVFATGCVFNINHPFDVPISQCFGLE